MCKNLPCGVDFGNMEASGLKMSWRETGLEPCAQFESLKRKGKVVVKGVPSVSEEIPVYWKCQDYGMTTKIDGDMQ